MTTLWVDVLNPKAEKLLRILEDLKLISIKEKSRFPEVLKKLRSKNKSAPGLKEITKEVELVRSKAKKRKHS